MPNPTPRPSRVPQKNTGVAYLWMFATFGVFGGHQFYLGNVSRGLSYCFTLGWFFVGPIWDLFTLSAQVRKANLVLATRAAARTNAALAATQQQHPPQWPNQPGPATYGPQYPYQPGPSYPHSPEQHPRQQPSAGETNQFRQS